MRLKSSAVVVLFSVIVLALACSDNGPEPPTATPEPTPTPAPQRQAYAPTLLEHEIAVSAAPDSWSPVVRAALMGQFGQITAMFIANECVAGRAMAPDSFLSFAEKQLSDQPQLAAEARRLIGEVIAVSDGPDGPSCIRPFLKPETVAEFALTSELVSAGLGWTARLLEDEKRIEWFGQSASERPPYLSLIHI